mmetsp:Transcript_63292/g.147407  ORF Transcript_63292/g.147407 Transcript_63292/m.147407 type:complete len:92 (-) Transcript_63292:1877-2152(-)
MQSGVRERSASPHRLQRPKQRNQQWHGKRPCQSEKCLEKKWCLEASAADGLLTGSSVNSSPTNVAKGACCCVAVSSERGRWLRTCRSEEED